MKAVPVLNNTTPSRTVDRDARYFRRNPTATAYTRMATAEERAQLDLPPGTRCVVVKLGRHKHARLFSTPDQQRN